MNNQFENLRKIMIWHRKKSKLTQIALADLAGVSRTAVQRLESGTAPLQTDTLFKLMATLNVQMSYQSPFIEQCLQEIQGDVSFNKDAKY